MRNIYVCLIHLNVRYFRNRMQYFLNNHFQIIFRTHTYLYLNLFGHLHIAHYLHIHMYKHVSHVTFTSTKSQKISKAISCCAPFHKHSYRASLESKQTCFNVLTVPASYFHTHTLAPNIIWIQIFWNNFCAMNEFSSQSGCWWWLRNVRLPEKALRPNRVICKNFERATARYSANDWDLHWKREKLRAKRVNRSAHSQACVETNTHTYVHINLYIWKCKCVVCHR